MSENDCMKNWSIEKACKLNIIKFPITWIFNTASKYNLTTQRQAIINNEIGFIRITIFIFCMLYSDNYIV